MTSVPTGSERTKRALQSTLVVSAMGYVAQGLSLLAIPLFLKTVGAEQYGLMVTVMAFMGYLGFADAGLSWGSMILVAQAYGRGDLKGVAHIVRHAAMLAVASGAVVLLGLGVILLAAKQGWRLPMFARTPAADHLLVIAAVQLAMNLQIGTLYNLFQGLQEGYWTGIFAGIGRILGLAGSMYAAWKWQSVEIMMLTQLGFNLLAGALALGYTRWRHPWVFAWGSFTDKAQYREQLRIGLKNFLLQIGRTLAGTAPTMAISSVLGPALVPFYTVPTTLLSIFFAPITSWNASMQSAYGAAWSSGEKEWIRDVFRKTLERGLLLGLLGISLFLALSDTFVRVWTHERLSVSPGVSASVSAIILLGSLVNAGQFLLTGLNCHRKAAFGEFANGFVSLVLVPAAVSLWGLGAIGLGVLCASLSSSVWILLLEVRRHLGAGAFPSFGSLAKIGLCAAASGLLSLVTLQHLPGGTVSAEILRLALAAGAGVSVYTSGAFLFGLLSVSALSAAAKRFLSKRRLKAA